MAFDIKKHLKQHAYLFRQYKKHDKNDLHFNFSILDLQFIANNLDIATTLKNILKEIRIYKQYKVKNGYYIAADGTKKQKYTTRTIDLSRHIKIEAIHLDGSLGEYTQPHIHLILDKNGRYGKKYSLLKLHISKVLEKYGLIANFDEILEYNPIGVKNLQSSIKKFFWSLKKLDNQEFKTYVTRNEQLIQKYIGMLIQLTQKTGNLDYYFKTMKTLQNRLNSLTIDISYNSYNLRHTYPIEEILSKEDKEVIQLIQNKKFSQKDIKEYLNNPILRDFTRYSYYKNTKNCYIVTELKKHTTLLQHTKPNKKLVDNYFKLLKEQLPKKKRKSQLSQQDNYFLRFKSAFTYSLQTAKSEKELKKKMEQEGFTFSWKKRKGKTIGIKWENKYIQFIDLGFKNIAEIRAILARNAQQEEIKIEIEHKNIAEQKEKNRKKVSQHRERIKFERIENERIQHAIGANIRLIKQAIGTNTRTIDRNRKTIENNRRTIEQINKLQTRKSSIIERVKEFGTKIGEFGKRFIKKANRIGEKVGELVENIPLFKKQKQEQKKEKKPKKSRNQSFNLGF